jgi:hypothetical protein
MVGQLFFALTCKVRRAVRAASATPDPFHREDRHAQEVREAHQKGK